ncbi:TetR family transcriptional regulator [Marinitenerispora sediminis]|uniref:TetR family transcriptional regulator n=1 Tax=Marinitenerispora sediminis TaxID=1931232 RepID=A0A368T9U1_9ACTN|nr:TetR family transcriptional regulator [Marinitenerispora sediminis]RCV58232.1 TetR family transcriptional regulator [Marinitenerispora sediminis]RCV61497.1 TetR family transcriptional regulator [Marinitenerispora sediminis]
MNATGLRERKKQATRRDLRRAALRLAAERGLENVTVEEIAAAANVSPRTFFNYFSAKEEAVLDFAVPGPTPEARAVFLDGGPAGELVEDLRVYLASSLPEDDALPFAEEIRWRKSLLEHEPHLAKRFMSAFHATEAELAEDIAARIGDEPDNVRPQLIAALATAALRFAMRRWVRSEGRDDLRVLLTDTFEALEQGL